MGADENKKGPFHFSVYWKKGDQEDCELISVAHTMSALDANPLFVIEEMKIQISHLQNQGHHEFLEQSEDKYGPFWLEWDMEKIKELKEQEPYSK